MIIRGRMTNIFKVWLESTPWEREDGYSYYDRQRCSLEHRVQSNITLNMVTAAFCALSPNNAESTTYTALDNCIGIVTGQLSSDTKVVAYPTNRIKALAILRGDLSKLNGRKVTSFYHNTLNPDKDEYVTIDGHMLGAWVGARLLLKRDAHVKAFEYPIICEHFREVAQYAKISAPRLQSTIWLTWKRLHKIIYNPQLTLNWE